ncbi:MAG TPA: hypothetical protein VHQ22_19870 [Terriglobales bacterium]|nr:hypothetical protein [Terriglobales bacterium]
MPPLHEHTAYVANGRKLVLWSLVPNCVKQRLPIVIGSGFGRRMDHFAGMALYLAHSGFAVARYDSLDHVGLSDGQMEDYTLSNGLASLETAIEWTCENHRTEAVGLVATSLTARLAYEMITRCPRIAFLVSVVGVIDVRYTLERVFGCDLTIVAPKDLPEFVEFQRQKIRPKLFYRDYHDQGWGNLKEEALALAPQPIVNFVAERDSWIDTAAVRKIFGQHQGPRRVLELEGSGHHLGVNPAIARVLMIRVTEVVRELAGAPPELSGHEPTFAELTEQVLLERRMQRSRCPVASAGASSIAEEPTILA